MIFLKKEKTAGERHIIAFRSKLCEELFTLYYKNIVKNQILIPFLGLGGGSNTDCSCGHTQFSCKILQTAASYCGSWHGDPRGTVATSLPSTELFSAAQEAGDGQQLFSRVAATSGR